MTAFVFSVSFSNTPGVVLPEEEEDDEEDDDDDERFKVQPCCFLISGPNTLDNTG